jgi:hypothetical protein
MKPVSASDGVNEMQTASSPKAPIWKDRIEASTALLLQSTHYPTVYVAVGALGG